MGVRHLFVRWGVAAAAVISAALWLTAPAPAFSTGPACGQKIVTAPTGVAIRILFANNGSVQRYEVIALAENTELVNDTRTSLENTYGPAGVNAPALRIISYKQGDSGSGGMMLPDKAIDSCGRTLDFN